MSTDKTNDPNELAFSLVDPVVGWDRRARRKRGGAPGGRALPYFCLNHPRPSVLSVVDMFR